MAGQPSTVYSRALHRAADLLVGFGEQDGQLFYSMEMVDGESLEATLEKGKRFAWRQVIQIGIQTSKALKHAGSSKFS